MNFTEAIKTCFNKYATFSGRARRSEFWYWVLFRILLGIVLSIFTGTLFSSHPEDITRWILEGEPLPTNVYIEWGISCSISLVFLLPDLAVSVRRLHDIGKRGWPFLLWYVFGMLLFWFFLFALANYFPLNANLPMDKNPPILLLIMSIVMFVYFLISMIYGIVLLVWFCKNSQAGENKYGPNPKELKS